VERSDLLMGTVIEQRIYGGGPIHGRRIAAKTAREIDRLEKLWSVFRTDSEINRIGKAAGERSVKVHTDTLKVLRRAKELSRKCGGCFDITAAPLTELWWKASMEGVPPNEQAVKQRAALVDWNSLELDDRGYAYLPRKGQGLDLGGIGKGFAADRAREIYRRKGVHSAVINLGGNVMTIGGRKNGDPWRVGIRYPEIGHAALAGYLAGYVEVRDAAVVSSGGYEHYFDYRGTRYHHILDPTTGRPADAKVLGVTVVTSCATDADAYATAVCVMGLQSGLDFLEKLPKVEGLVFDNNGVIHLTTGLQGIFFRLGSE
jgi:thiamine biosynthesis lipoprotein